MGSAEKLFDNRKDEHGLGGEHLDLLTYDDLEKLIKVAKRTLRRWVARDEIPYIKIGRRIRFSRPRIYDWLRERGDA